MRLIAKVASVFVAAAALFATALILGFRRKSPVVIDAVRNLSKQYMNPKQMLTAGTPGAYAGIIRHVGRTSGKQYETPVGIEESGDGFVIVLPYGRRSDWLQNVLAAGSATIVHEGQTIDVTDPLVVPLDMSVGLPADEVRVSRVFGVSECLRVRPAG